MKVWKALGVLFLVMAGLVPPAIGKVYVRWTQGKLPPAKILGVNDVVIPWSEQAQTTAASAKKQGYHVYFEASLDQATSVAEAGVSSHVTGILLKGSHAEESQLAEAAQKLRQKYPKLKILVVNSGGKQPEIRGWLVFNRNGILQVSSPSQQPWLDGNLALVRYERTFDVQQAPLYTFSWDESDPMVKQNGPKPADYSRAVAEAGAFHADLILPVHEHQQTGLASGDKWTLADWEQVKKTVAFYDRTKNVKKEAVAVAVLTDDYNTSYEAINLMARHNIPYRVLHSADTKAADLAGYELIVAFSTPRKELADALRAFAEQDGVVVVVNQPGSYPWDVPNSGKKNGASTTYTVGKGRVIELGEPVSDPETFAQDIRRLMEKQYVPVSLWNSLTTLVVEYPGEKTGEAIVELVNYDEEATQVQVQVRGSYGSVKYESPDRGCCETLKPSQVNGFTEFVVPNLVNGGRVHLQVGSHNAKEEVKTRTGDD
jgi:hypothetical protein